MRTPKSRPDVWRNLATLLLHATCMAEGVMGDRQRVMARITELCAEPGRLSRRAAAGLDVLRSHPMVDGRLAAVGYCFGGMTVLELARSGVELLGAASVHGTLKTAQRCQAGAVKAKMLVCHG